MIYFHQPLSKKSSVVSLRDIGIFPDDFFFGFWKNHGETSSRRGHSAVQSLHCMRVVLDRFKYTGHRGPTPGATGSWSFFFRTCLFCWISLPYLCEPHSLGFWLKVLDHHEMLCRNEAECWVSREGIADEDMWMQYTVSRQLQPLIERAILINFNG